MPNDNNMSKVMQTLNEHHERISGAETAIKNIYSAFPSADAEGHRRYHELIIADTEERRRLRVAIEEKTISGLIWSFIVFCCATIWQRLI